MIASILPACAHGVSARIHCEKTRESKWPALWMLDDSENSSNQSAMNLVRGQADIDLLMYMDSSPEKYSASQSQTPPDGEPLVTSHLIGATSQSLQHAAQGQPVHYLDSTPDTLPFEAPPPPPSSGDGVPALGRRAAAARWPGLTCPACGWRPVEPGAACPHCFAMVPVVTTRMLPWRLITVGALALVVILSAILVFTLVHHGPRQSVAQTIAPGLHATIALTATAPAMATTLIPTAIPTLAVGKTPGVAQPTPQPALPPGAQSTPTPLHVPTPTPAPTNTPTPQPIALPGPPAGASTVWPTLQTNGGTGCSEGWQAGAKGINFVQTTGSTNCYGAFWHFSGNQTCSVWVPIGQDIVNGAIWSPNSSIVYGANSSNWSKYGTASINQQANIGNIAYLGAWSDLQQVGIGTGTGFSGSLIEAGPLYYACN